MSRATSPSAAFCIFANQFCRRLFLVGFAQREKACTLAVPPNTVPNPVFFAIHDLNAAIEPWCQCSILRKTASISLVTESLPGGGIGDRNRVRRNLVGEIGPGRGLHSFITLLRRPFRREGF